MWTYRRLLHPHWLTYSGLGMLNLASRIYEGKIFFAEIYIAEIITFSKLFFAEVLASPELE